MNNLIRKVMKPAHLKDDYVNLLIQNVNLYKIAFTTPGVDQKVNYELYELLGDAIIGQFVPWYFVRRFPQLNCPAGVPVIARLKINYVSNKTLSKVADKLGFWEFVNCNEEERKTNRKKLLEDTFEAFVGVTAYILENHFNIPGLATPLLHRILTPIYDKLDVSLDYDKLYDSKTRLKQMFDSNKHLGRLEYNSQEVNGQTRLHVIDKNGTVTFVAFSTIVGNQGDREQEVSTSALNHYIKQGIVEQKETFKLICE
jgi:dsRNA-specific ribonuclease